MPTKVPLTRTTLSLGLTVITLALLLHQAYLPAFRKHLQTDIIVFQQRTAHFLTHGTWKNLSHNEHQPGTLWFFVGLGKLASNPNNFSSYLTATVLANIALVAVIFAIYHVHGHRYSVPIFALLLVTSGPILLYRFETIVGLLTILAWISFRRHQNYLASGLLGLATAIKIYPVILLPPLLAPSLKRKKYHQLLRLISAYVLGLALPTAAVLATGSTLSQIKTALHFHSQKPITTEGIVGQGIVALQNISDIPMRVTAKNSIHGFTSDLPILTNDLLNYAWVPPLIILYLFLWRHYHAKSFTNPTIAFAILLTFVIFAKVLNPQYLWWPLFFLPLIPLQQFSRHHRLLLLAATAFMLIVTTYIFPLHYSDYLAWFNGDTTHTHLFIFIIARNLLLLTIAAITFQSLKNTATNKA